MPLTLNVGLAKKVGLPAYGSLGVSCSVEVELDAMLLLHDQETFQQKVRQAYVACQQAVQEELHRQQESDTSEPRLAAHGLPLVAGPTNGQARDRTRPATTNQVRAIETIARRQQLDLGSLLQARFSAQAPADLSIAEASSLIDELNSAAPGTGGGR